MRLRAGDGSGPSQGGPCGGGCTRVGSEFVPVAGPLERRGERGGQNRGIGEGDAGWNVVGRVADADGAAGALTLGRLGARLSVTRSRYGRGRKAGGAHRSNVWNAGTVGFMTGARPEDEEQRE